MDHEHSNSYLTELYLYGETTLIWPGTNERYVLRQGNAVPAWAVQEIEDTQSPISNY